MDCFSFANLFRIPLISVFLIVFVIFKHTKLLIIKVNYLNSLFFIKIFGLILLNSVNYFSEKTFFIISQNILAWTCQIFCFIQQILNLLFFLNPRIRIIVTFLRNKTAIFLNGIKLTIFKDILQYRYIILHLS